MPDCWEIRLSVADHAEVYADLVAAACDAEAVSYHREDEGDDWQVSVITRTEPSETALSRAVGEAASITGTGQPRRTVTALPERDWLEENRRSFPPIDIGSFHIRGSHVASPVPEGRIPILLDAGQAFGSGTHATTRGCLAMLERCLEGADGGRLRIADIGCGSGILALAAAKLLPEARIVAVDNDPVAVGVAEDNAAANGAAASIAFGVSDGYGAALVREHAPFDVVMANILPSPLIAMAPDAAACLAPGGALVVSGLNGGHEGGVVAAHEAAGLAEVGRISLDGWVTLVFRLAGGSG